MKTVCFHAQGQSREGLYGHFRLIASQSKSRFKMIYSEVVVKFSHLNERQVL